MMTQRVAQPHEERDACVARYEQLLAAGLAAHPPPTRRPRQPGRIKPSPARTLLERLLLGQDAVPAFRDDLTIPCDHQQTERGLRGDSAMNMRRCS